jgi:purine-binding chemotaxis protein CheW
VTPYLGFRVGSYMYGLPLPSLREVATLGPVRRIQGTPPTVAGLVNVRGEIICALDAREILGLARPTVPDVRFLVVLRRLQNPIGLIVDSISDVYTIDADHIQPLPETWPASRAAFLAGMAGVPAGPMGLLVLEKVVA